jgi:hypothetical protein
MLNVNVYLVLYWGFMIIAAIISTWGTFVTLPYEHLGQWEAIKMALPFAWVDWIFLTLAIYIGNQQKLATPLQMKFGITMLKFFLIMLFTKYYLHSEISRSDVVGFVIVFIAYGLNVTGVVSKYLGIPVEKPTPPATTATTTPATTPPPPTTTATTTTTTAPPNEPDKKQN